MINHSGTMTPNQQGLAKVRLLYKVWIHPWYNQTANTILRCKYFCYENLFLLLSLWSLWFFNANQCGRSHGSKYLNLNNCIVKTLFADIYSRNILEFSLGEETFGGNDSRDNKLTATTSSKKNNYFYLLQPCLPSCYSMCQCSVTNVPELTYIEINF